MPGSMRALVFAAQHAVELPSRVELPSASDFLNGILSFVPSGLALVAVVLVLFLLQRWLATRTDSFKESHRTRNQLVLLGVSGSSP